MISFRFHIVSITAVFLAIAIGVVVGTTYVDRAVVDSLESRVDTVSNNLDQRKAENDALERDLDDVRAYAGASAEFAVTGRLTDVPVLLVAVRGVDEDVAGQTLALARRAGASVPGITWVESRWGLEGDDDHAALADAAGVDARASDTALRGNALAALIGALGVQAPGVDPAAATSVVGGLVAAGFLSVDAQGDGAPSLESLVGRAPRLLVLTTTDVGEDLSPVVPLLVERSSSAGLPTVAAEAYRPRTDGPKRGELLRGALDEDVRDQVGLVDDAEVPEGRVAAILALGEVAAGRAGHFGYGSDASSVLPPWSAP